MNTRELGDWERTSHCYYDGQRMIEERDNSGAVLKQYVWGQQYIDELVHACNDASILVAAP